MAAWSHDRQKERASAGAPRLMSHRALKESAGPHQSASAFHNSGQRDGAPFRGRWLSLGAIHAKLPLFGLQGLTPSGDTEGGRAAFKAPPGSKVRKMLESP